MILLLSIGYERSTDEVVDHFLYNKRKFLRINCDNLKDSEYFDFHLNLSNQKAKVGINNTELRLDEKKVIWYRRIRRRKNIDRFLDNKIDFHNSRLFTQLVFKEWELFLKILINSLSLNSLWFDYPYLNKDKLDILIIAKKIGFEIPETFITNNVRDYADGNFITKLLSGSISFIHDTKVYTTYTSVVKKVRQKFLPALIQQKIEKRYEIRTFYLDGECYSMAIFSQNDKQTKVDFRNYNRIKPNRTIPYKLPQEIEEKIKKLMDELNLKTGSLDIIRSTNGKYYFLEVNPVGQFGMTSKPCNYKLEQKIFEKLVDYEENL
ncbi:grasp-with-spasm system ATP-grasp peptide maturase [Sinomicrobium weinanense]|uniref:Grasp-with-spasm system ATP-grasp peptide maturase n=1 Tax=Sinomicrobium weinanense TaxID=2842200 RepID=A0A926JVQ1_9FLAO|nr:grasp-with-spasm system ATP-grasp peptide maturase [Sinomicrobium weinanense]MBC9798465.1 grasp-with-spasm system ATP-grasp peptide maturase [Sinomicrobium weinanense]MBU3126006.1 grasp-with-spasm system ATP-grasp peptide maturase [Sinomicrobium weinanense]